MMGDSDVWVTAEAVADAMTALVEQDEIEVAATAANNVAGGTSGNDGGGTRMVKVYGGMILEVSKGSVRVAIISNPLHLSFLHVAAGCNSV